MQKKIQSLSFWYLVNRDAVRRGMVAAAAAAAVLGFMFAPETAQVLAQNASSGGG